MRIINEHKLLKCSDKVVNAFKYLLKDIVAEEAEVVVTSGARDDRYVDSFTSGGKYLPSWHDEKHGHNAIDFYLKDENVFAVISILYELAKNYKDITELEVCRGVVDGEIKQHIHVATGTEPVLETFTGVYK